MLVACGVLRHVLQWNVHWFTFYLHSLIGDACVPVQLRGRVAVYGITNAGFRVSQDCGCGISPNPNCTL
jgi:hypothetical protein